MYHPSRGGVRGGRDQFSWDDVKADKHRENYLGHSIKAPVGRWQKGKDLHWYVKEKKADLLDEQSKKEEIKRIKEEEEQAMREILGLAPKRQSRPQGNRLDKREAAELLKKGSSADDLASGYVEGERVQGLGFSHAPHHHRLGSNKTYTKESIIAAQDNQQRKEKSPALEEEAHKSEDKSSPIIEDDESKKLSRKEEKKRRREERKLSKLEKKYDPDSWHRKSRRQSESYKKHKKRHDSESSD